MRLSLAIVIVLGIASASQAQALPGTELWESMGHPPADMVQGLHKYLDRETAQSASRRETLWPRFLVNTLGYERLSVPRRARLMKQLGMVDARSKPSLRSALMFDDGEPVRSSKRVRTRHVAWRVFDDVEMFGWLLEPLNPEGQPAKPEADVVVIGDAGELLGIDPATEPQKAIARRLAESGVRVLVPTLIDRMTGWVGDPATRKTNLSHREWLYRMAFETGRHPIGYEVQAVQSAIDWFMQTNASPHPIGVVGHGEGGRIALYAGAIDTRITATWVGGAFGPREKTWSEPIDRNVFGLLKEFGDAEVASLVCPRALQIEPYPTPTYAGSPIQEGVPDHAAKGRIEPISFSETKAEVGRFEQIIKGSSKNSPAYLVGDGVSGPNANRLAERGFLAQLSNVQPLDEMEKRVEAGKAKPGDFDPSLNVRQQLDQWVNHTQALIRSSELRRNAKWAKVKTSSLEGYAQAIEPLRQEFWNDLIGKLPPASEPMKVRTKQILDEPTFQGFAVEIPVWPDVVASGVLLLPKDLKPGETRPVIVCQHGLEGTPDPIVNPKVKSVYHSYGAQLADRGYIVYAPQNPYIGNEDFRSLQRKAQPLGKTLFAIIVRQHERTLEWLKTQPNVDPKRIAFYGLSYGGKTAMRVPAILSDYCLSICSADFNEWVVKCTNIDRPYSYMYTVEHDMYEWNLAEGFNYAEMAALIAPRPFMVERGHLDGVAPDEWVGYEYAKVRRLYSALGIADRTEIGYFAEGHQIDGKATFAFLAKHLDWPRGVK